MNRRSQKVNDLVLRNFITSISVCFAIIVFMAVMFGFDLEDQIFENQVSMKADQLSESMQLEAGARQTVTGLEMEYFQGTTAMPDWLANQINPEWEAGEYEVFGGEHGHYHLAVRGRDGAKQYLIFNARPYVRSTKQVWGFVILIALLGGLMLLVTIFFVRRMTRKLTMPIEKMAAAVTSHSPLEPATLGLDKGPIEIEVLAKAIADKDRHIENLIQRERQFNRDVSHELRTPLAVAVGAAEIIEKDGHKSSAFTRLQSSLGSMRLLTEGILWLGREPDSTCCSAWKAGRYAIEANEHLLRDDKVKIEISGNRNIDMPVPEAVAQVIIGNLVRNAIGYTSAGTVSLAISEQSLSIEDTGVGFDLSPNDNAGFGIGLSLVKRLCSHFGMRIAIAARKEGGTIAVISWPGRRVREAASI
ncbi:sensor histidine kinase [Parasphingorhabdus sp.]|uniref:sensor histidine kinase n=1 Tax=Parasphingorhabdus sp. TaxID=2709688 RepID=UPI003D2D3945